jgi:hypothetical protein
MSSPCGKRKAQHFICPASVFMETFESCGLCFSRKPSDDLEAGSMNLHRRVVRTTCVLLVAAAATQQTLAEAQVPTLHGVSGVSINYVEPTNPAHKAIYDRMKKRQVLEEYQQFMSPLRMKRSLTVTLRGCNGVVNAAYAAGTITYCYELVAEVARRILASDLLPGFRREDAVVGGFVHILLHETGHAIFDLFDIPIFGREEDAADAIAAYVVLQMSTTTARRVMTGAAFIWRASEIARQKRGRSPTFQDYADEHGTDAQRFYNMLCIALGSDLVEKRTTFQDFVQLIPESRRRHCPKEYLHVKESFARFVLPHVDRSMLKKMRETEWLRSEDGIDSLPPQPPSPDGGPSSPGPGSAAPRRPDPR